MLRCASAASPWSISSSSTTRHSPSSTTSPPLFASKVSPRPRSTRRSVRPRRWCVSIICSTACRPSSPAASSSGSRSPARLIKEADLLLLDEPLVNLDYKLREELRAELKSIFQTRQVDRRLRHHRAGRGAAARRQHRCDRRGPHPAVGAQPSRCFHHPASVRVTQVFSEPPMNLADGTIADGRFILDGGGSEDGGIEAPLARSSRMASRTGAIASAFAPTMPALSRGR